MRTFILNTINQIPATNRQLDYKSTLKTNEWKVFTDSEGEVEKFLFMDNEELLVSVNGKTSSSKWQFMKVNSSLIIDDGINKYMFKVIVCSNDIVFLNVDSTNNYSFLINTKSEALKDAEWKDIQWFLMKEYNIDLFDDDKERMVFYEVQKEDEKKKQEETDRKVKGFLYGLGCIALLVFLCLGLPKIIKYNEENKKRIAEYNYTHPKMYVTRIENRQAVDLGLSVKWATCNIGANHPTGRGNEYGWGDPTGVRYKDFVLNRFGYREFVPENRKENEYAYPTRIGEKAPVAIVGTQYDVAKHCWGDKWRMPTRAEAQELIDSCKFYIQKNIIVAIGPSGDSILFPFCPQCINQFNEYATGELDTIKPQEDRFNNLDNYIINSFIIEQAMIEGKPVIFNGKTVINAKLDNAYRYDMLTVRAVCEK
jgi:hypothetical protein